MLENETVTGENAKRIINGEQPIVEKPSTEQLAKQKELNDAYMQLSLVDSYSIRDGHLTPRIADEEVREYFVQAYERVIEKLGDQLENQENVEEANQAKELLMFLRNFSVRDRTVVLDKYSALLYHHSLDKVSVEDTIERVKQEMEQ